MEERRRRFEEQVMPHLDAANNLARWLARDATWSDDIVQDAMLRAFKSYHTFSGEDAKPWLLTIVRNCFFSSLKARRMRLHVPLPEGDEPGGAAILAEGPDPEEAAIEEDVSKKVGTMIAKLPPDFREAIILREMENFSYREIAEVTGVPIGTVMSRLARGRELLRKMWVEMESGHGVQ